MFLTFPGNTHFSQGPLCKRMLVFYLGHAGSCLAAPGAPSSHLLLALVDEETSCRAPTSAEPRPYPLPCTLLLFPFFSASAPTLARRPTLRPAATGLPEHAILSASLPNPSSLKESGRNGTNRRRHPHLHRLRPMASPSIRSTPATPALSVELYCISVSP
jgi:hypothetical protein